MADLACSSPHTPALHGTILETAIYLYDIGLNVGPQPYEPDAQLKHFPWKKLQYTYLPRDHPVYGLHRLFAGRCNIGVIRGAVSRNLFTIDCYSDKTLNELLEDMGSRNIARWAIKRTKSEGGEIWLLYSQGEVEDLTVCNSLPFQILDSGYILCPPFEPEIEIPVHWLVREGNEPPTVTLSQMDWLFFETGERIRSRKDELRVLMLAGKGHREQQSLQEIRQRRATTLLAFAQSREWPGKAGTTDRDVFLALIQRMKTDSSRLGGVFRASERELAELAHHGRKAVHRSLERLKSQKLILYAGPDTKSRANRYRFPEKIMSEGTGYAEGANSTYSTNTALFNGVNSTYYPLITLSLRTHTPLADTLEPAALGRNALIVYDTLMAIGYPLTMSAIAAKVGMSLNKVRTAILKLIRFGMAEHRGKRIGYVAVPKTIQEIVDIAKEAGTDGKTDQRKAKHVEEQSLHAAHIILLARQERDEVNLPLEMQPPRDWRCPSCGDQTHSRYGQLPEACPHCGQVTPVWIRLPRPKKRPASRE